MLLPQAWDGANLTANLLLLPSGDPTATVPLTTGHELSFAIAQPVLRAAVLSGLETPPWAPAIPPASMTRIPLTLPYSGYQQGMFAGLVTDYTPAPSVSTQDMGVIRKDLPQSYLEATGFRTPNGQYFTARDGFGCALGGSQPNTTPVTPRPIQWGEIISYALRQPLIAQALGIMYLQVSIPIAPALVKSGGWIWLEIDTRNDANWYAKLLAEKPAAVATYAARLPALTTAQDVFAAILFPTVSGNYDSSIAAAQNEADTYLNGFAKVVHANQPLTSDAVTNGDGSVVPGTDAGVQIGWDDEQVTTWVNRQIGIAQAKAAPPPPPGSLVTAELPFTLLGYRVDVRESGTPDWSSLCAASGTLNGAGGFTTSFIASELCVEPTPIKNAGPNQDYWLPQYFAQWRGRTLVVNDQYGYRFSGGQPPATTPSPTDFNGTTTEVLPSVGLRYGQTYQFRTRLADLTGGGPEPTDPDPSDAAVATLPFRRYVPPKQVPTQLSAPDSNGVQTLTVDRPGVNYPEMVFAGAADQSTLDALLAVVPQQPAIGNPPAGTPKTFPAPFQAALLDPDVTTLQIIVEAEAPVNDTGSAASLTDAGTPPATGDLDGVFRVVYVHEVDYPAISTPVAVGASTPIELTLVPTQTDDISAPVEPDPATPTVLPMPTGRNLRLRLRAVGKEDPGGLYFGRAANANGATVSARTGLMADLKVRFETTPEETGILAPGNIDQQLQAFYLRDLDNSAQQNIVFQSVASALKAGPVPFEVPFSNEQFATLQSAIVPASTTPLQLLASALNLPLQGQTLSAPAGQRIIFGAQHTLRHSIPQDLSSITFSTQKDLINHWIVAIRLTLARDWTWRGLAQNGPGQFGFQFQDAATGDVLGEIDLPGVVTALATQRGSLTNQRGQTELIFFTTIDSAPASTGFPAPTEALYQLMGTLTGSPTTPVPLWSGDITVPITSNPVQIPRLVSAGIAETPYIAAPDYSSTTQRQRALWLEFDGPPNDPNNAYFIRVQNYGPDPLLCSNPTDFAPAADSPIPLDPEPIRIITPDSSNDDAGLAAMIQAIPSGPDSVHFLVPLPDAVSPADLQLFGFWTYEIRCGHLQWSTAQGRFGRPLRVAGVQHPCPPLTTHVERVVTLPADGGAIQPCIVASADLAQTVYGGVSLTTRAHPQTSIWFLLYAQLQRADGDAWRNLLLAKLPGVQTREQKDNLSLVAQQQEIAVSAAFSQAEVDKILAALHLPANTALSALAVELFNRENAVMPQPPGAVPKATALPDPLGTGLGSQRILRVSPLTPVRNIC